MHSFDIKVILTEMKEFSICNMRIKKVYQKNSEFRFKLYGGGRKDLIIKPDECIYLTRYPKSAPKNPSGFVMFLRKKLGGLRIRNMRQINFDRIIEMDLGFDETVYRLIIEFFGEGNLILTDNEYEILSLWKRHHKRELYVGKQYEFPESNNIFADFVLNEEDTAIVKVLATEYDLGGLYAEELCLLSGIDKTKSAGEVDIRKLEEGIKKLGSKEKKVNVIDDKIYPFELLKFKNKEKKYYESLNKAFDEIYGKKELIKEKKSGKNRLNKKIGKYERIAASQKKAIKKFERDIPKNKKIGDLIYLHYQEIEKILETIEKARETHSWNEIQEAAKKNEYIASISPKKMALNFEKKITIEISKDVPENAKIFYDKSKKAKKKIEGAKKALQRTREKIDSLKSGDLLKKKVTVTKRRKREWYEKFKWCFSSEDYLMIGGRDKKTNEMLVKRYMDSTDLYLHADIHGAPHVIVKDGQKCSEKTVDEAAVFAASFSRAWKKKIAGVDVYWVYPEQVTKSPPSGEYLPTGAFFIKGEKRFIKHVPLSLAIGIFENKPMCGSVSAVKANCKKYVEIVQGDKRKEALAKILAHMLGYDNLDEIIQVLPTGRSRLKH
ncbi:MAG: ribosome rescue protein RqcH [Euryarchaeota archaeon]|nr:ribosome rescue protein RqcH [Euryarchaeota archaeon]